MKYITISPYGLLVRAVTEFDCSQDEFGDPVPYHVSKELITGCALCNRKDNLKKCMGCEAVYYCCREHQLADRPEHKLFCNIIRKGQDNVKREEMKLNLHQETDSMLENPFKNHVGHFWWVTPTRNYMRARFSVVDGLMHMNSELAVKQALDNILDMLRLSQPDNIGVRSFAPSLYLRLGRDQEAYDFLKWYATTGIDPKYNYRDLALGFLDVRNADIFEPVYIFIKRYALRLSHIVSLMLLKIRLLVDIISLEPTDRQLKTLFSEKVIEEIKKSGPTTRFGDKTAAFKRDQTTHIRNLKQQIMLLYNGVKCANQYMWPAMLNPGNDLTARPYHSSWGERTEMQLALQANYNAYMESVGALDVITNLARKQ